VLLDTSPLTNGRVFERDVCTRQQAILHSGRPTICDEYESTPSQAVNSTSEEDESESSQSNEEDEEEYDHQLTL